jgi:hypothetical protein
MMINDNAESSSRGECAESGYCNTCRFLIGYCGKSSLNMCSTKL